MGKGDQGERQLQEVRVEGGEGLPPYKKVENVEVWSNLPTATIIGTGLFARFVKLI